MGPGGGERGRRGEGKMRKGGRRGGGKWRGENKRRGVEEGRREGKYLVLGCENPVMVAYWFVHRTHTTTCTSSPLSMTVVFSLSMVQSISTLNRARRMLDVMLENTCKREREREREREKERERVCVCVRLNLCHRTIQGDTCNIQTCIQLHVAKVHCTCSSSYVFTLKCFTCARRTIPWQQLYVYKLRENSIRRTDSQTCLFVQHQQYISSQPSYPTQAIHITKER